MFPQFAFSTILILCSIIHTPPASAQALTGCDSKCGNVEIPYPFGMKDPKCYAETWFEIECRNTTTSLQGHKPYLKSINLEVLSIYALDSTIDIMHPIYHHNCNNLKDPQNQIKSITIMDLTSTPFVYSKDRNKFMAVGCNKIAFLMSSGTKVSGCVSFCADNIIGGSELNDGGGCNGKYCCQTSLPSNLSEFNVTIESLKDEDEDDDDDVFDHHNHECSHALIAKDWTPEFSYSIESFQELEYIDVVLEWEIVNPDLKLPGNCNNTNTNNVTSSQHSHSGRRCFCDDVSFGNPYIDGGCKRAKDDAFDVHHHKPSGAKWAFVGVFSSLGSITLLIGLWWLYKVIRKRIKKKRKEKYFKQNGGLLLEQRFSSGEANIDRVKHFSLKDLEKATDHFNTNRVLGKGGQGTVYKGMLIDGKIVAVKKFKVQGKVEEFINEFVVLSQINHKNVVKLLGCCLETEIPLLVYEFIPNGNLFEYLHEQNEDLSMTWDMRLRIAVEVAGALFYLHSVASQPIYHRDVKSTNILLDGKYRAKLADFGASRIVSAEATHLTTKVQGTFGYLDPEYFHTSQFTEKSDVYSFGIVLVELLTGEKAISSLRSEEERSLASYFVVSLEENRLFDIIDKRVMNEGEKEHVVAVANLAYRCLELNGRNRPTMKEVTLELEGIRRLDREVYAQEKYNEEIELARTEVPLVGYSAKLDTLQILSCDTLSSYIGYDD